MYNFILIKKHFFQQIMGIISNNYKKKIIILSVFPYLLLISDLITPFIYGLLIDEVMLKKNIFLLKWILIVYFCVFCFDSLVRYCQKKFQIKTYNNLKLDLRLKMWFKYLNAPFEFYRKNEIGDLKERIDSDVDKIEIFLNEQIINSIYLLISMVIYMVIIFNISIILALVSLFIIPMIFVITKCISKRTDRVWGDYRDNYGKYESWLQMSLQNWKEIKVLNIEENQTETLEKYWNLLKPDFYKGNLYSYLIRSFTNFANLFITRMNLYFIGGLLIFNGDLKIGILFVFIKYYEKFYAVLTELINISIGMSEYKASLSRVIEVLKLDVIERKKINFENNSIKFENVSFKYKNSTRYVLKGINLDIGNNSCISIVGKSGIGKSTLIKLLLGMYEDYEGEIYIGGHNIKENIKYEIAAVTQDSTLFNMSIKKNLQYAKSDATMEEIMDVCKKVRIHNDIIDMPEQYNTIVGE